MAIRHFDNGDSLVDTKGGVLIDVNEVVDSLLRELKIRGINDNDDAISILTTTLVILISDIDSSKLAFNTSHAVAKGIVDAIEMDLNEKSPWKPNVNADND